MSNEAVRQIEGPVARKPTQVEKLKKDVELLQQRMQQMEEKMD